MKRDEAIARLHEITAGIDQSDNSDEAWWETSTGADFGAERLRMMEDLVTELTR